MREIVRQTDHRCEKISGKGEKVVSSSIRKETNPEVLTIVLEIDHSLFLGGLGGG